MSTTSTNHANHANGPNASVSFAPPGTDTSRSAASGVAASGGTPVSILKSSASKQKEKDLTGKEVAEKLKGGKLASLVDIVASQPAQIATVIEKESSLMLDLVQEIVLKSTPLSRFGTTVKKKNGTDELYTPGCIRQLKNPITGSTRIKESDEFKSIVSDFDEALKKFKDSGRALLEKVAKLEVSKREKLLQKQLSFSTAKLAKIFILSEKARIRVRGEKAEYKISDEKLAWTLAWQHLKEISDPRLAFLKFDSLENFSTFFHVVRRDDAGVRLNVDVDQSDDDKSIGAKVKTHLDNLIPKMTFEIWERMQESEYMREINKQVEILETNSASAQLTEETAEIITQGLDVDKSAVGKYFKERENKLQREFNQFKKEMRSNSLAGRKNHRSAAKNNGQNTNKSSKEDKRPSKHSRKNRKQKKSDQQQNQSQKKQSQSQKSQKQRKSAKRGRDSQEGSPSGRSKKRSRNN